MMPACTGLPPGELISKTTAWAPSSSNALRMAETMTSALASPPEAISPLTSTMAVCGWLTSLLCMPLRSMPSQTSAAKNSNQARRIPYFQRRAARCSASWPCIHCSSTLRSPGVAGAPGVGGAGTAGASGVAGFTGHQPATAASGAAGAGVGTSSGGPATSRTAGGSPASSVAGAAPNRHRPREGGDPEDREGAER